MESPAPSDPPPSEPSESAPAPAAPQPVCPHCGAPIPADAPQVGGAPACPVCLLGAGIPTGGRAADPHGLGAADVAAALPQYEILGFLGRGGMGVVWKARHRDLDRVVALKVLPRDVAALPGFSERFRREARALARLAHPNIVSVHEAGECGGLYFLAMEHVDGVNLRQALREGRIGPHEVLRIVPQICDALQYAHDHGVVHRDIKPENVLVLADGRVKVADFGLAKIAGADASAELTLAGQVMGTPAYMAPEQVERPMSVDHRADIYSLGVVFYEMLTGELPLGRFDAPSKRVQVDVRLDEVVLRSLEKAPERRWQQASEMKSEVGTIASGPPAPPPPPPPPPAPIPGAAGGAPGGTTQAPPRLSRLAIAASALALATIVVTALAGALALEHEGFSIALVTLASTGAAAALVLGVVAWVRVRRSNGALRGTGFAVSGALLPLLFPCLCMPVAYVLPARHAAARFTDGEVVPVPVREEPTPHGFTLRSLGGFPASYRELDAREIRNLWTRFAADAPAPSDTRTFYEPGAFERLRVVDRWPERGEAYRAGVAGFPLMDVPGGAAAGRLVRVTISSDRTQATAEAEFGDATYHIPLVRKQDQVWYFDAAPVVVVGGRVPEPADPDSGR